MHLWKQRHITEFMLTLSLPRGAAASPPFFHLPSSPPHPPLLLPNPLLSSSPTSSSPQVSFQFVLILLPSGVKAEMQTKCARMCVCVRTRLYVPAYVFVCVCARVYVCLCACMPLWVSTCRGVG